MEVKNIHNNPEERGFFGKVLGYIVNGLRSMARPKKNTKWDYLVPLSLVGLQFLVMGYGIMNQYVQHSGEVITKSIMEIKDTLIFELIFAVFVVLSIIFLTRLQRVTIPLLVFTSAYSISIFAVLFNILNVISPYSEAMSNIILMFMLFAPFLLLEYFIANMSLLIKFGRNVNTTHIKRSTRRSTIAWACYGFGIDILNIYTIPSPFGSDVVRGFIFEGFYEYIGIPPLAPLFTILFALIGYSIEKYKQRRR